MTKVKFFIPNSKRVLLYFYSYNSFNLIKIVILATIEYIELLNILFNVVIIWFIDLSLF